MSHRNNLLPRLATGFALACITILPAMAQDATVNADGGLRLRTDASTTASIVLTMPNGASIDVQSDLGNGWYQVNYLGHEGYSSAEYITLGAETPAPTTDEVTEPEAPAEEEPTEAPTTHVRVVEGPLNIRSGPSTSYDRVGSVYQGAVIEVFGIEDGWYKTASGYISGDYVTDYDPSAVTTSGIGQQIADFALQYVGTPYVYGGSSPSGWDCSGFTYYVYRQFGFAVNRTASTQMSNGTYVSMGELQPGDAVFFDKYPYDGKPASHVGIYIGNGQFVHASEPGVGTIISNLDYAYYTTGFVGGRRMG